MNADRAARMVRSRKVMEELRARRAALARGEPPAPEVKPPRVPRSGATRTPAPPLTPVRRAAIAAERKQDLRGMREPASTDTVRDLLGACMWPRTEAGDRLLHRDLAAVFGPSTPWGRHADW